MNILSGILLCLLAASIGLYVLSFFKNLSFVTGITSVLLIPLSCFPIIIGLNNYLPDSHHIKFLSTIAIILISVSEFFIYFNITKWMKITGEILYIFSLLGWIQLYKTTFYLFRISTSSIITEVVILSILLLILLIYIRKQDTLFYILKISEFAGLGLLNFSSIITMSHISGKLYPVTFFIATVLFILEYIIFTIQTTRPVEINRKIERGVRTGLITFAQILMTLTGLLMIK